MSQRKYDTFYQGKSTNELFEAIKLHRKNVMPLNKEWYEGLVVHLRSRNLSLKETETLDKLLNADVDSPDEIVIPASPMDIGSNGFEIPANQYPALITISGIYTVLSWIIGLGVLIAALLTGSKMDSITLPVLIIVIGAFVVLGLLAMAEVIRLFIDIEFNTRKTANNKP